MRFSTSLTVAPPILTLLVLGCVGDNNMQTEAALCSGTQIEARRGEESLRVTAHSHSAREIAIEGYSEYINLTRRENRWYGSLGLYTPGEGRQLRVVAEEGQQHFQALEEVAAWLAWRHDQMNYIHTSDGLVIGWTMVTPPDGTSAPPVLRLQIWQIYIQGNKPTNMLVSDDSYIRISNSTTECTETAPGNFEPSAPQMINVRWYAGKAIDYMEEKGWSYGDVENALQHGERIERDGFTLYSTARFSNHPGFMFVMIDSDGRVVLVG